MLKFMKDKKWHPTTRFIHNKKFVSVVAKIESYNKQAELLSKNLEKCFKDKKYNDPVMDYPGINACISGLDAKIDDIKKSWTSIKDVSYDEIANTEAKVDWGTKLWGGVKKQIEEEEKQISALRVSIIDGDKEISSASVEAEKILTAFKKAQENAGTAANDVHKSLAAAAAASWKCELVKGKIMAYGKIKWNIIDDPKCLNELKERKAHLEKKANEKGETHHLV